MEDMLYNAGGAMVWVIPALIVLFCLNKIRKNRAEIKSKILAQPCGCAFCLRVRSDS